MKKTGIIITAILFILAIVGSIWTPYSHTAVSYDRLQGPSAEHILGTDNFGRDILSRIMKGLGTTMTVALLTVAIGALLGTLIGAVTGYYGGWVDRVLMRFNDAVTAFPTFLLALLIVSLVGPGSKYSVVIALSLVFIPGFARVMRTEYASLACRNFVISARLMGAGDVRIMFRYLLPNTMRVLLPALTIGFNNAVLAEAGLSFLGIGVSPPEASLGYMLSESQSLIVSAPWYVLSVGLTIVLLVFGVGMIGEGSKADA